MIETYTYGASRNRLVNQNSTQRTYYAWGGNSPLVEYTEPVASSTPAYSRSYVYAGSRLLSTSTKKTSTTQEVSIHHPDRLGTGAISTPSKSTYEHNSTLPFGTALAGETSTATNQPFTSYDRSASTGLDYAVNRTCSQGQGRFTQVDPIGMAASIISIPQSLNLYSYTRNMPADFVDPSGLLQIYLCTRFGFDMGEGNIIWSDVYFCELIFDDGGGIPISPVGGPPIDPGDGGGGPVTSTNPPRQTPEPPQDDKFKDCVKEKMKELRKELDKLMKEHVLTWAGATALGGLVSPVTGLGASAVALTRWLVYLEEFNQTKWEPALKQARKDCEGA